MNAKGWSVETHILSIGGRYVEGHSDIVHEDSCGWEEVVFMTGGSGLDGPQPPARGETLTFLEAYRSRRHGRMQPTAFSHY